MTTWKSHLRIAENLLAKIDGFDPYYLAIGSVAPDSGVRNAKAEQFEPPVEVTHYLISREAQWPYADVSFYRQELVDGGAELDRERQSFLWGYYFHLVTDNLWDERVGRPTRGRFA